MRRKLRASPLLVDAGRGGKIDGDGDGEWELDEVGGGDFIVKCSVCMICVGGSGWSGASTCGG